MGGGDPPGRRRRDPRGQLRTGLVLAPHGGLLKRVLVPFRLGAGGRQGSGRQWMSWISLDDEVAAIIHVLGADALGRPGQPDRAEPGHNAEFAATLGRVLHRPALLPTPTLPLKARYGKELVEQLLLGGQRVVPERLLADGYGFHHPTLERHAARPARPSCRLRHSRSTRPVRGTCRMG